jgi:hypothetical protein
MSEHKCHNPQAVAALLADLAAVEAEVERLTRERDEARRAVRRLATVRERDCRSCRVNTLNCKPAGSSSPGENCIRWQVEYAYTSTGGTPPEKEAQP